MDDLQISTVMGIGGFVVGLLFGILTHRTNFCTMGSISDAVSFGDFRRMRAWLLAIAVAIAGAHLLHLYSVVDLTQSIYLGASLNWIGAIVGGSIFGFGMVLSSGCPGRNLVRVGSGDLRALVVLIFVGLFGYMALRGLTAPVRDYIQTSLSFDLNSAGIENQQIGTIFSSLLPLSEATAQGLVAAIAVAGLLFFCFRSAEFRTSPPHVIVGIGAGVLITAGWWFTGVFGADDFEPAPLTSLTFIAPTADGLQYLMTYTGATINFGVASVGGAILGAYLSALTAGHFNLSTFYDKTDTIRHMLGGAMMGTGGVLALGCTIGQGMTGISTLSLGSLLAVLALVFGGYQGIKYMERAVGL